MKLELSDETLYQSPEIFCEADVPLTEYSVTIPPYTFRCGKTMRLLKTISYGLLGVLVTLAVLMLILNLPVTLW